MTELSRKVFEDFQIRKTRKQKEAFWLFLCGELKKLGYDPTVEQGSFGSKNIVVGDPESARVLFTAHYDTCPVLPFPNFITPRNGLIYILFNLLIVAAMFLIEGVVIFLMTLLIPNVTGDALFLVSYALLLFFCWWMMFGAANKHTANDNTSGVLTLLETAQTLPGELRNKVCFVFFDNEEKGLFGSSSFVTKHKKIRKTALCVNFDCVSDGDHLHFFPTRRMMKKDAAVALLRECFVGRGGKTVSITTGTYPSDQRQFRRGVGVCALKKAPIIGYYMDRIHTNRDTVLEEENIRLLAEGAVKFAEKI